MLFWIGLQAYFIGRCTMSDALLCAAYRNASDGIVGLVCGLLNNCKAMQCSVAECIFHSVTSIDLI